jgi:hypothetical protein
MLRKKKQMLIYKEDKDFLNEIQKQKCENLLNSFTFPFYLDDAKGGSPNQYIYLSHHILHRLEDQHKKTYFEKGPFNSEHGPYFMSLLHSFCKNNNIVITKIHRMAVNLTFNLGKRKPHIHTDHKYDYYHLIIYLNNCDAKGCTMILDKKKKIIKRIKPEKYKGVCFNKHDHYQLYPKKGLRIVAVYTFS